MGTSSLSFAETALKKLARNSLSRLSPQSANNQLIIACEDNFVFTQRLPAETMKLIVTSPPYNLGKEYGAETSLDAYLEVQKRAISECVRQVLESRECHGVAAEALQTSLGAMQRRVCAQADAGNWTLKANESEPGCPSSWSRYAGCASNIRTWENTACGFCLRPSVNNGVANASPCLLPSAETIALSRNAVSADPFYNQH